MTQDQPNATPGDTMPVVRDPTAVKAAYKDGFNRFDRAVVEEADDPMTAVAHFKETARWANHVAPQLRAAAGFDDAGGMGTYTAGRVVAVLDVALEDDGPAAADVMRAGDVYTALVEAFDLGAYAALDGHDSEPWRAVEDVALTF